MGTKAVMAKSLNIIEDVSDILDETNGDVDRNIKQQYERQVRSVRDTLEYLNGIQEPEQSTNVDPAWLGPLKDCINYLIHEVIPPLGRMVGASYNRTTLSRRVQKVRADTEAVSRTVDLLEPHPPKELAKTLQWTVHEGVEDHLGRLIKIKEKIPPELKDLSEFADQQMSRRVSEKYDPDRTLQIFFGLNQTEFAHIISDVDWTSKLPDSLQEYSPLKTLELTKAKMDKMFGTSDAKRWLSSPVRKLNGQTPDEVIKEGGAFTVLQLLVELEEGIPD